MISTKRTISAFALMGSLAGLPAVADTWPQKEWQLDETSLHTSCPYCSDAEKAKVQLRIEKAAKLKTWVEPEMQRISDWLQGEEFAAPVIKNSEKNPDSGRIYFLNDSSSREVAKMQSNMSAAYTESGEIELPVAGVLDEVQLGDGPAFAGETLAFQAGSLAHELHHGVVMGLDSRGALETHEWVSEGLAEAVGLAWARREYGASPESIIVDTPRYDQPLTQTDAPYGRGHFFYYLGEGLSPQGPVSYMPELTSDGPAGDGAGWIDTYLKGKGSGLKQAFNRLIADHTDSKSYFGPEAAAINSPSLVTEIRSPGFGNANIKAGEVGAIAARYEEAAAAFAPAEWEKLEDRDRVYARIIYTENAERANDLTVIVDGEVQGSNERHVSLIFGAPGEEADPAIVKVTNVAEDATSTTAQSYELKMQVTPIGFDIPPYVQAGSQAQIELEGSVSNAELKRALARGDVRLSSSSGSISSDLVFNATGGTGSVDINLTLPTVDGGRKTIELGAIDVQNGSCGIRMTFSQTRDVVAYWDPVNDLTEYKVQGRTALMQDGVMYVQDPRMGWVRFDLDQFAGLAVGMSGGAIPGLGGMSSMEAIGGIRTFDLPDMAMEAFEWDKVVKATTPEGQKMLSSMPNSANRIERGKRNCIFESGECAMFLMSDAQATLQLTYDKQRRLTEMNAGGHWIRFEHGDFTARPLPAHYTDMSVLMNMPR